VLARFTGLKHLILRRHFCNDSRRIQVPTSKYLSTNPPTPCYMLGQVHAAIFTFNGVDFESFRFSHGYFCSQLIRNSARL
jgi:hypothetical protein